MKKICGVLAGVLALLAVVSFAHAADPLTINGAGATFPYPLYSKWFYEYSNANPGVRFNYQSIGSGGGIKQITAGTVNFGATDAPMSPHMSSWFSMSEDSAMHITCTSNL